jgi:hypothetical protein
MYQIPLKLLLSHPKFAGEVMIKQISPKPVITTKETTRMALEIINNKYKALQIKSLARISMEPNRLNLMNKK